MATFIIQVHDGSFSFVNHDEFFETLNSNGDFLYYKQGGTHIALLPTASNTEMLKICRQAENAENYEFAVNSRCLDANGHLCRYRHDANGRIIRNAAGKPISAKCSECSRDGWIAGNRENCCLRNYCTVKDCEYCQQPREYRTLLSLERITENNDDGNGFDGIAFGIVDSNADIVAILESAELLSVLRNVIISELSPDERAVINAIYRKNLSQRAFASESGMSRRVVKRIHDRALETLRENLKDFI